MLNPISRWVAPVCFPAEMSSWSRHTIMVSVSAVISKEYWNKIQWTKDFRLFDFIILKNPTARHSCVNQPGSYRRTNEKFQLEIDGSICHFSTPVLTSLDVLCTLPVDFAGKFCYFHLHHICPGRFLWLHESRSRSLLLHSRSFSGRRMTCSQIDKCLLLWNSPRNR